MPMPPPVHTASSQLRIDQLMRPQSARVHDKSIILITDDGECIIQQSSADDDDAPLVSAPSAGPAVSQRSRTSSLQHRPATKRGRESSPRREHSRGSPDDTIPSVRYLAHRKSE